MSPAGMDAFGSDVRRGILQEAIYKGGRLPLPNTTPNSLSKCQLTLRTTPPHREQYGERGVGRTPGLCLALKNVSFRRFLPSFSWEPLLSGGIQPDILAFESLL